MYKSDIGGRFERARIKQDVKQGKAQTYVDLEMINRLVFSKSTPPTPEELAEVQDQGFETIDEWYNQTINELFETVDKFHTQMIKESEE